MDCISVVGVWQGEKYCYSAPFLRTDAGRAESRRPKQKDDCTVRAYALVTGRDYDDVYDELAAAGRKCSDGFHLHKYLPGRTGWVKHSFPAEKGKMRMCLARFAQEYNTGCYIARCAGHVVAVIDGVVMDWGKPWATACVYTAFEYTGK